MRNLRKTILLCAALVATSGCEDVLDLDPLSQYSDALVWNDLVLVKAVLDPMYASVRGLSTDGSLHVSYFDYADYGDESYCRHGYGGQNWLYTGAMDPSNSLNPPWNNRYTMIQRLNLFLERIDAVPGDATLRARLKAEAQFLRGYYYAELAKHYGDVPLITESFELGDDYTAGIGRTPFAQVAAFVASEMDAAAAALPGQKQQPATDRGRATKGAALALKADILLYAASPLHNPGNDRAKWQAASDAAKAIMDSGDYTFYTGTYYDLTMKSAWNSEIIFGRIYGGGGLATGGNNIRGPNTETWFMTNGYGGWSAYTPQQQLVDAYRMANGMRITEPGSGYDPNNPYVGREKRFYETIHYDGAMYRGRALEFWFDEAGKGGRDTEQGSQPWNSSLTRYAFRKFNDESKNLSGGSAAYMPRIWPTYRLSEIYLTYAEAQYQLGNEANARTALNAVRTRTTAGLPASQASGAALLADIRTERQIELVLEAKRYFDLLRWKEAGNLLNSPVRGVKITKRANGTKSYEYFDVVPRTWKDAFYFWPIPRAERLRTDLPQNPGYVD